MAPCRISDAPSMTIIVKHLVYREIFNSDDTILVNDSPALLVCKIPTPISDTLIDTGDNLTSFGPGRGSFDFLGEPALCFGQVLFILMEKTRILDLLFIRESGKSSQPNINAHGLRRFWQRFIGRILAGKTGEPLACTCAFDTTCLDSTLNKAMKGSLDCTNLGQGYTAVIDSKTTLRIGEAVIPSLTTKTWISRLLIHLYSAEEGLESQVDSYSYILKHLAMRCRKRSAIFLETWEHLDLIVKSQRFLVSVPDSLTLFQKIVVKPATFFQYLPHYSFLGRSRIQPIAKAFVHFRQDSTNIKKRQFQVTYDSLLITHQYPSKLNIAQQ